MTDDTDIPIPRASNVGGILILLGALPPLALALHALAGATVAAAVCGVYAAALALTVRAERGSETPSRDPLTGLPDRAAAIGRLESIVEQRLAGSSQAAVFVVSIAEPQADPAAADRHPVVYVAIAHLAQGLRRGDQIIRIGENSLAAILGPSRGLTARAAEGILERIDGLFREPLRVGPRTVSLRASLGVCLQHDAPRADAQSWLKAAELAAMVAAEDGEPRLFPSGATKVDRSAWDEHEASTPVGIAGEDEAWIAAAERRAEDPPDARHGDQRRRA